MLGALFVGRVELLAADAVEALVVPAVQVGGAGPPEPFDAGPVPGVGAGTDEVIKGERERSRQPGELGGVAVDEIPYGDPLGLGGPHVLERVVVGARLKPDLVTEQAVVPGEYVCLDELQGEAQVGARVDVRDGRGEQDSGHRNLR